MPTVPRYDGFQVQPNSLPSVRFDAPVATNTSGEQAQQLGKGLMQASQGLGVFAAEMAAATAKEYDNKLADALRLQLHDPNNGYLNTVGKDAVYSRDAAIQAAQDSVKTIGKNLGSTLEQEMFGQVAQRRLQSALQQIDMHAARQIKVYDIGQTTARMQGSLADAVANWTAWKAPESAFSSAKATMLQEYDQLATLNGLGDDQRKQGRVAVLTGLHDSVINNMVSLGQNRQAQEYLASNVKEISPDKLDNLQKLVKIAGVKDDALTLSMALKGGLQDQLNQLKTLYTNGKIGVEVYDDAKSRVEHNWATRKAQEAEGDKNAMGAFQDWILKNPGKTVLDAPPQLYQWAKGRGQLSQLDAFAQREGRPSDRIDELRVRGGMLQTAMQDPNAFINEFKRTGFSDRLDLGVQGIKEMQNMATDMISGNGKFRMPFNEKIIQDAIPKALLVKDKKDQRDAFVALMIEAGDRWRKANPGKQPDANAYAAMAAAANEEYLSIGSIWNSSKKAYEVRTDDDADAVPKSFFDEGKRRGKSDSEIKVEWQRRKGWVQ